MSRANSDDCDDFLDFVDEFSFDGGIDIFERIGDAIWNGSYPDVRVSKTRTYHPEIPGGEYSGEYDIGDFTFSFRLESSNMRGDVMHSWELHE